MEGNTVVRWYSRIILEDCSCLRRRNKVVQRKTEIYYYYPEVCDLWSLRSVNKGVEDLDGFLPGTKRWLRPAGTWEKAGRKLGTSDTTYTFFKGDFKVD